MGKILILLLSLLFFTIPIFAEDLPLNLLHLPPGFSIRIFAYPVPDARQMVKGKEAIYVGTMSEGKVYALVPDAASPYKHKLITIISGLKAPTGVALKDGNLYVADIDVIYRFDQIEQNLKKIPKPVVVTNIFPKDTHHGWRYIGFGPEGKLYLSIGMPCNVCLPEDPRFGTIMRMEADGKNMEIFAKGIRNSVGFDWNPSEKVLWFTDNGRDWLGDNSPPDKLAFADKAGLNFGFPYFDTPTLPNSSYVEKPTHFSYSPPAYELPAHVAALGMKFYTGDKFPVGYSNNIIIAEHGSWNRSRKVGYQVVRASIKNNTVHVENFITGWLQNGSAWGRPVDILNLPDGSILISDDRAGAIYQVTYSPH